MAKVLDQPAKVESGGRQFLIDVLQWKSSLGDFLFLHRSILPICGVEALGEACGSKACRRVYTER